MEGEKEGGEGKKYGRGEWKEEERTETKEKKREKKGGKKRENRDRCIRRRVSQIRNLLTMVRKAIHLDDRGESVIY